MDIFETEKAVALLEEKKEFIHQARKDRLLFEPFYRDFSYRFCWNSNAIEGNTLSLEETVSLLEYDEVRSGHTYTEYEEAKRLNDAIRTMLSPKYREITETWIMESAEKITGLYDGYRTDNVYVGTVVEAVYYPPSHENVPGLMKQLVSDVNFTQRDFRTTLEKIAETHIRFERIHPFHDGNGRTGRLLLNQMMMNHGLLPVIFSDASKYRQSFRRYDRSGDISMMVYLLCKGEREAVKRIEELIKKRNRNKKMTF